MKKICLLFATAALLVLASCKENMTSIQDPSNTLYIAESDGSFESEMLALWEGINQSYVFWDIDNTDWDSRRPVLIALGQELDNMQKAGTLDWKSDKTKDMIAKPFIGLLDHHMAITIVNPYIPDSKKRQDEAMDIVPSTYEIEQRSYYHERPDFSTYKKGFMAELNGRYSDFHFAEFKLESGNKIYVISALIDGSIPYLHMSGYDMGAIMENSKSEAAQAIHTYYTNIKNLKNAGKLKAIILDNRANSGGSLGDLAYVAGSFLTQKEVVMYTRTKNGLGKYDFANWETIYIDPATNSEYYVGSLGDIPYVVLHDLHSVSMGEMSSNFISRMSNAVTIGERTYGGHGTLMTSNTYEQNGYNGTYNDGGPGHSLYTTNTISEVFDKKKNDWGILEGIGLEPDIECIASKGTIKGTEDNQLKRALQYINEKR